MKHLTPAQVERVEWFSDVPGFAEYVDDVIGYLHTAREYPPERLKAYKIRQEILAGRQVPDAWFNATQILTGAPAETLIEHWNPSKVPNVNRELHNAIRFFVAEYGVTPSKTMHGDLARLVGLILQAAGLLDDPSNSSTPQNIIRAALKDL